MCVQHVAAQKKACVLHNTLSTRRAMCSLSFLGSTVGEFTNTYSAHFIELLQIICKVPDSLVT